METVMEAKKAKRKMWYQEKIEALEAKIAELEAGRLAMTLPSGSVTLNEADGVHYESYAEGYCGCLRKYALLRKEQINVIKKNLITQGPRYIGQSAWTRMKF